MSRPQSTSTAPTTSWRHSPAEILLANLRLLDLNLREDWPDLTARTFATKESQQGQKQRIRCTEWILYRLFELWDPEETRDKLQPFFPPLEPLQSLNLRGALFRVLNELKKNGVLGREIVLRKTMLDECKGDKLMELLVVFSTVLVRKKEARNKSAPSRSCKIAANPILNAAQQGSLIPLTIAHCASLSTILRRRQYKKEQLAQFNASLDSKRIQLRERVKASIQLRRRESSAAEEAQIKRIVQDNWIGNERWRQTILTGDETSSGDLPLQQPFSELWNVMMNSGQVHSKTSNNGLLANLERRVQLQSEQLEIWQEFRGKLKESHADPMDTCVQRPGSPRKAAFAFDRHQALQFIPGRVASSQVKISREKPSRYHQMLLNLQDSLAAVSMPGRLSAGGANSARHDASQPEITSHDLFSPVKSGTTTYESRGPEDGAMARRQNIFQNLPSMAAPAAPQHESQSLRHSEAELNPCRSSGHGMSKTVPVASNATVDESTSPELCHEALQDNSTPDTAPSDDSELEDDSTGNLITTPGARAASAATKQTLSLMERTRLSMASFNLMTIDEPASVDSGIDVLKPELEIEIMKEEKLNRRLSLLDRTRLSMAQVSSQPSNPRHPSRKEMRQSLFPINQFETPGKRRAMPSPRRNATPTEKLFSEEAEYASVFRSRPRIAVSPTLSPAGLDNDQSDSRPSELDDEDDQDVLEEWGSSPLDKKDLGVRT